jgi:hypothetical protein
VGVGDSMASWHRGAHQGAGGSPLSAGGSPLGGGGVHHVRRRAPPLGYAAAVRERWEEARVAGWVGGARGRWVGQGSGGTHSR